MIWPFAETEVPRPMLNTPVKNLTPAADIFFAVKMERIDVLRGVDKKWLKLIEIWRSLQERSR
jgi:hypothetical protein